MGSVGVAVESCHGERCVDVVDLDGRTVIPGLLDNHTHFIRTLQAAFAVAAKKAEPGECVTVIGGFTHRQFREQRLPARQELTAAVPDHPVYIQIRYCARGPHQ
jgi:predicted amidohydrolase YtcJ